MKDFLNLRRLTAEMFLNFLELVSPFYADLRVNLSDILYWAVKDNPGCDLLTLKLSNYEDLL